MIAVCLLLAAFLVSFPTHASKSRLTECCACLCIEKQLEPFVFHKICRIFYLETDSVIYHSADEKLSQKRFPRAEAVIELY